MPLFIQGMYATVLGVSFYKIALIQSDIWKPVQNVSEFFAFFKPQIIWAFFQSEYCFRFLLFASMLLILAHDWFSYHLEKRTDEDKNYWYYAPQLFSLFFLAQMFGAIEVLNFQYWYVFAFWYTISNIVNIGVIYSPNDRPHKIKIYAIHTAITGIGFFIVPEKFKWPTYHIALGLTFLIVVLLWKWKPKKESDTTKSNDTDKLEAAIGTAEAEAKTARDAFLSNIKLAVSDIEIVNAETTISTTQDKAKSARLYLITELKNAKAEIANLKEQLRQMEEN